MSKALFFRLRKKGSVPDESGWRAFFSWRFSLACVLSLLMAFVCFFPISLLKGTSVGSVVILDAAGTWWKGEVRLGLAGRFGGDIPGTWFWRMGWDRGLVVWLNGDLLEKPVKVEVGLISQVQSGRLKLPAVLLERLGSVFPTLRPEGTLMLEWQDFRVDGGRVLPVDSAKDHWVSLLWKDASLGISSVRPLGDYELQVRFQDVAQQQFILGVKTFSSGRLLVEGLGDVSPKKYFLKVRMSADSQDEAMGRLLDLIGQKKLENGRVFVDI
jgi:hypothetical protein